MIYLFDWGNTLMVDFPHAQGKMCDWEHVETVPQATETLAVLSQNNPIYIATSASDSNMEEVQRAFVRVDLDQFLNGYFVLPTSVSLKTNLSFISPSQNS